jgi:hypothetical protein
MWTRTEAELDIIYGWLWWSTFTLAHRRGKNVGDACKAANLAGAKLWE